MNIQMKWPVISIVMATLNSSRTIKKSLDSLKIQKYKGKIELLILDGGSSDDTLKVARQNGAKVYFNKLKTAEAAKALGVKKATGSIIALIDSDNVLTSNLWLEKLVKPLVEDSTIIASEPIYFEYREIDHWLTRYFALIGMGDPVNLFIGNYDKYNYLSKSWTNVDLQQEEKRGYIKVKLVNRIPTIGANGFLIRKSVLDNYPASDYLFDVDVLEYLVKKNSIFVAKVNQGVVHLFSGDVSTFIRKQRRRIRDYLYHYYYKNSKKTENSLESPFIFWGIVKFVASCILVLPLVYQTLIGYSRKKDIAWLFHPIACYITFFSYTYETIRFIFIKEEFSREGWKQ
ncbi:MAG: glycosyl transferase [uncultured bacterium]|nr:MAG: glycosyl transferase [uncultured bacterium]